MKFFVAILTSSDTNLCKLTYNTIINQEKHNLDYDTYIIVNSKNTEYYSQVVETFKNEASSVKIIETESNGYPGKGHNSVLHTFKNLSDYDYCILIDSGDFFYPTAFHNIGMYLAYKPDILFVSYHDNLSTNIPVHNVPYFGIENKCFLIYNIDTITSQLWYESKGKNPFNNNINSLNTPARPIFFSKKILEYDIFYDENMKLYDDFIVFIKCFELCVMKTINMFLLVDSNIYLYNTLSSSSATHTYNIENNRDNENINFMNSIKNKYLAIRDWDLKQIPRLSIGQYNEPGELIRKLEFVVQIVNHIPITKIYNNNDNNIELIINHAKKNKYIHLINDLQFIEENLNTINK